MKDYKLEIRDVLLEKVNEGLTKISAVDISDKEYGNLIMNILNSYQTAKDYNDQINSEKESEEK